MAREAAAMVLLDDELGIPAIEQGRVIFVNLRKFVVYLLSCNLSEITTVGVAAAVNAPLPMLPLQILFLDLVTDVIPALALGVGEGTEDTMRRSPRQRGDPLLARRPWLRIGGYGALIAMAVLAAFALALRWLEMDAGRAVTVSFLTLAFAQLVHVLDMAEPGAPVWRNEVTRNRWALGGAAAVRRAAARRPTNTAYYINSAETTLRNNVIVAQGAGDLVGIVVTQRGRCTCRGLARAAHRAAGRRRLAGRGGDERGAASRRLAGAPPCGVARRRRATSGSALSPGMAGAAA